MNNLIPFKQYYRIYGDDHVTPLVYRIAGKRVPEELYETMRVDPTNGQVTLSPKDQRILAMAPEQEALTKAQSLKDKVLDVIEPWFRNMNIQKTIHPDIHLEETSTNTTIPLQEGNKFVSELNWDPDDWFSHRVEKPDGTKYTQQDVNILKSHVPEYLQIEQEAKKNGTWLQNPDGSYFTEDPRIWVMMQSEAFKRNYRPELWYTGQARWNTKYQTPYGTAHDKVTRAPFYNEQMWFSNSKDYGDTFANYISSDGLDWRYNNEAEKNVTGVNFPAVIPKIGNYRYLDHPKTGTYDYWQSMPFRLNNGTIERLNESEVNPGERGYTIRHHGYDTIQNTRKDRQKVLTDDVVNWSKDLGDDGIFMYNVYDGPVEYQNGGQKRILINEIVTQPGFTEKVKFPYGNNGNFDPEDPYKYSYNTTEKVLEILKDFIV